MHNMLFLVTLATLPVNYMYNSLVLLLASSILDQNKQQRHHSIIPNSLLIILPVGSIAPPLCVAYSSPS